MLARGLLYEKTRESFMKPVFPDQVLKGIGVWLTKKVLA